MSAEAIVMMVVAMVIIWGGLVLALVNLRRNPDLPVDAGERRDV
jgi:hypothetical protein